MKIKHQSLFMLLLLNRLFLLAQADSVATDAMKGDTGFYPHKALFQLSVGLNKPTGFFGSVASPFSDGFALTSIMLHAQYSKPVYHKLNLVAGIFYSRNNFDNRKFNKAYLDTYGDTVEFPTLQYQNIGFYAGVSYSYPYKRFLFTANIGLGGLYTSPITPDSFAYIYPRPGPYTKNFIVDNGTVAIGKTVKPLILYGVDVKYLLRDGIFIIAQVNSISSSVRYRVWDRQNEIIHRNIPFENLTFTVGLGAVFR